MKYIDSIKKQVSVPANLGKYIPNANNLTNEMVEDYISEGIKRVKNQPNNTGKFSGGLMNIYFVGQTLCLDIENEYLKTEVFTINWSDESFGNFKGGYRKLLSLKALKLLKELMVLCDINFQEKKHI